MPHWSIDIAHPLRSRVRMFFEMSSGFWSTSFCVVPRSRSCELNNEPDDQHSDDQEHHVAHSRGCSPITRDTSRLPVGPPAVGFPAGNDRRLIRHVCERKGAARDGAVPECTGARSQHIRALRAWAAGEQCARTVCDQGQRRAGPPGTVGSTGLVEADRGPYAADRRRSRRIDRGGDPPQNTGARWCEWKGPWLDEREMARPTSGVAVSVVGPPSR
jgi:hypothetical protein